jgi:hypothetical protein
MLRRSPPMWTFVRFAVFPFDFAIAWELGHQRGLRPLSGRTRCSAQLANVVEARQSKDIAKAALQKENLEMNGAV